MADKADIIVICGPTATGKTALSVALAKLLDGMICHVNLIPVNPVKERGYDRTAQQDIRRFVDTLGRLGVNATVRRELGSALKLRYTPELSFVQDDSIVKGAHILELLRDPEVVKPVNPDNPYQEDKGI